MKKLKNQFLLLVVLMVSGTVTVSAQDFQGVATYQSAAKGGSTIQFKGEGITPEMQKQLDAAMKKQSQKEYTLNFNLSEASWQEVESLGNAPGGSSGTISVVTMSAGSGMGSLKYRNTAENLYLEETSLFGKPFLIKDELVNKEWVLTDETKKIGDYTVQKAVYERTVQKSMLSFSNFDDDEEKGEPKMITDTIQVEAWFTTEIPVSHGPDSYWGLPGLILELNNGSKTFLCTKVVLNPEETIEIKKPRKGKKVNRDEYTELVKAKMEEMSGKYSGGNGAMFKVGGGE